MIYKNMSLKKAIQYINKLILSKEICFIIDNYLVSNLQLVDVTVEDKEYVLNIYTNSYLRNDEQVYYTFKCNTLIMLNDILNNKLSIFKKDTLLFN